MDPQENLKRVANYPKGDAGPYLLRLQSVHESTKNLPAKKLCPLVTAVWSSQFYQVQGLVQHITDLRTEHLDITFIVYDLGLYRREREIVSPCLIFLHFYELYYCCFTATDKINSYRQTEYERFYHS